MTAPDGSITSPSRVTKKRWLPDEIKLMAVFRSLTIKKLWKRLFAI
jgi:hypothetical protein